MSVVKWNIESQAGNPQGWMFKEVTNRGRSETTVVISLFIRMK